MARAEFSRLNLKGVPAFLIGDQVVVGLDKQRIEVLLNYIVISCGKCDGRMRLPKNKGKIRVTCPSCSYQFMIST
ncbi:hypothetical protein SAMN05660472_01738 [Natronincola ferrireducens]|uniref:Thioredoxin domain-containing protein n=1 Tax=Natronincola ferrireducens TaxID=393762 RepID=A0A1G9DUD6_9FIRM|nr:hypothetical protein SAMN05660472_01738 [Natronincola ferrireducens]